MQTWTQEPTGGVAWQLDYGSPITEGLRSVWLMNEGSGDTVFDLSGNGNHGTLTSASWGVGDRGHETTYDGSSDYASSGYAPTWTNAQSFTIGVLCRTPNTAAADGAVFGSIAEKGANDPYLEIEVDYYSFEQRLCLHLRDDDGVYLNTGTPGGRTLDDGQTHWLFMRRVFGDGMYAYVDDLQVGYVADSWTGDFDFSGYPFYWGCRNNRGAPSTYKECSISATAIWERALATDEIASLYREPYQLAALPLRTWSWASAEAAPSEPDAPLRATRTTRLLDSRRSTSVARAVRTTDPYTAVR